MLNSNSNLKIDRTKICPKCKYDANPKGAVQCQLCQSKLIDKTKVEQTNKLEKRKDSKSSISRAKNRPNKANQIELAFKDKTKNWLNFVRKSPKRKLALVPELQEAKKPVNLAGLILIGL